MTRSHQTSLVDEGLWGTSGCWQREHGPQLWKTPLSCLARQHRKWINQRGEIKSGGEGGMEGKGALSDICIFKLGIELWRNVVIIHPRLLQWWRNLHWIITIWPQIRFTPPLWPWDRPSHAQMSLLIYASARLQHRRHVQWIEFMQSLKNCLELIQIVRTQLYILSLSVCDDQPCGSPWFAESAIFASTSGRCSDGHISISLDLIQGLLFNFFCNKQHFITSHS